MKKNFHTSILEYKSQSDISTGSFAAWFVWYKEPKFFPHISQLICQHTKSQCVDDALLPTLYFFITWNAYWGEAILGWPWLLSGLSEKDCGEPILGILASASGSSCNREKGQFSSSSVSGWDGVVGIATGDMLDILEIKSWWQQDESQKRKILLSLDQRAAHLHDAR
jgi:hypothetical protein